jgi:glycerol kinase
LKDQLGLIGSAEETEALAASVEDNGGVYLVPAFAGLGAPHWAPDARAAVVGLSAHSTRAHVARAALESIGYQVRDVLDMFVAGGGVPPRAIHADGGATRNRFLMQFLADVLGVDVAVARMPDCSSLGAVMAGMLGSGACHSMEDFVRLPREQENYRPTMSCERADALHWGWKRAVRQTLAGCDDAERS